MKTSENLMYCEIYESKTGHDGEHLCWECVEFWDTDADGFVGEESTCGQNECCAQCGSDLTIRADGSTIEAAEYTNDMEGNSANLVREGR